MKTLALETLQRCGFFALARMASATRARILVYHNFCGSEENTSGAVSVAALRTQLEYLRRDFRIVPLSWLLEQLKSGSRFDKYAVALTVDDGRRNFYEFLFPLIKEFGVPVTFFVVSSFISGEDWVWTDKVLWLSKRPDPPDELSPEKIGGFFSMLNRMRPDARNACIKTFAASMGIVVPSNPPPEFAPCSWGELREMADSGLVEIGSHTVTHPVLSSLTDEETWQELTVSRVQIEREMGRKVNAFGIPNGIAGDYGPRQLQLVMEAGYEGAVLSGSGIIGPNANRYELPRMGIADWTDRVRFSKLVDGVEYYQARVRELQSLAGLGWNSKKRWPSVSSVVRG